MDEIINIAKSFCDFSIYSLKNKQCESLNNKIERLDEKFCEMSPSKKNPFIYDNEFLK